MGIFCSKASTRPLMNAVAQVDRPVATQVPPDAALPTTGTQVGLPTASLSPTLLDGPSQGSPRTVAGPVSASNQLAPSPTNQPAFSSPNQQDSNLASVVPVAPSSPPRTVRTPVLPPSPTRTPVRPPSPTRTRRTPKRPPPRQATVPHPAAIGDMLQSRPTTAELLQDDDYVNPEPDEPFVHHPNTCFLPYGLCYCDGQPTVQPPVVAPATQQTRINFDQLARMISIPELAYTDSTLLSHFEQMQDAHKVTLKENSKPPGSKDFDETNSSKHHRTKLATNPFKAIPLNKKCSNSESSKGTTTGTVSNKSHMTEVKQKVMGNKKVLMNGPSLPKSKVLSTDSSFFGIPSDFSSVRATTSMEKVNVDLEKSKNSTCDQDGKSGAANVSSKDPEKTVKEDDKKNVVLELEVSKKEEEKDKSKQSGQDKGQ